MFSQTYYLIPFWVFVLIGIRLLFTSNNYTAILLASFLFGAVEFFKATKSDDDVWRAFKKDIRLVGHRGCALNAPENTLASVHEAHRLGVNAIEIDVLLTSDGEPIVFHDSSCERTTDGVGQIESMRWRDVQQLDASCKYTGPGTFPRIKVPHLREVLQECKNYGIKVFLDMKGSRALAMTAVLAEMCQEFPDLHEWAVVCSFYPQLLFSVKQSLPQFPTILTHRPWVLTDKDAGGPPRNKELWKKVLAPVGDILLEGTIYHFWWYMCGVNAVFIQQDVISVGEVRYWRARGIDVFVWTVNEPHRKAYMKAIDVPYITDDCTS